MSEHPYNVLFLCTGNSARSIIAEGILNSTSGGRFKAYSAGSHPSGSVHPFAEELLRRFGIATDAMRSKSWDEFASPGAPRFDFVFTVCDSAAAEPCPVWPGQPMTAHWGVPDPAAAEGSDEARRRVFLETYLILQRRISLFVSLPHGTLDKLSLKGRLDEIGKAV